MPLDSTPSQNHPSPYNPLTFQPTNPTAVVPELASLIYTRDLPRSAVLTWVQLRCQAGEHCETSPLTLKAIVVLTGLSPSRIYRHLTLLKEHGALRWRRASRGETIFIFGQASAVVDGAPAHRISDLESASTPIFGNQLNSVFESEPSPDFESEFPLVFEDQPSLVFESQSTPVFESDAHPDTSNRPSPLPSLIFESRLTPVFESGADPDSWNCASTLPPLNQDSLNIKEDLKYFEEEREEGEAQLRPLGTPVFRKNHKIPASPGAAPPLPAGEDERRTGVFQPQATPPAGAPRPAQRPAVKRPASKPTATNSPAKPSPAPEPGNPVSAYTHLTRLRPNQSQRARLLAEVSDLALWQATIDHWQAHRWNPMNIPGMLDLYQRGGPSACRYCSNASRTTTTQEAIRQLRAELKQRSFPS